MISCFIKNNSKIKYTDLSVSSPKMLIKASCFLRDQIISSSDVSQNTEITKLRGTLHNLMIAAAVSSVSD